MQSPVTTASLGIGYASSVETASSASAGSAAKKSLLIDMLSAVIVNSTIQEQAIKFLLGMQQREIPKLIRMGDREDSFQNVGTFNVNPLSLLPLAAPALLVNNVSPLNLCSHLHGLLMTAFRTGAKIHFDPGYTTWMIAFKAGDDETLRSMRSDLDQLLRGDGLEVPEGHVLTPKVFAGELEIALAEFDTLTLQSLSRVLGPCINLESLGRVSADKSEAARIAYHMVPDIDPMRTTAVQVMQHPTHLEPYAESAKAKKLELDALVSSFVRPQSMYRIITLPDVCISISGLTNYLVEFADIEAQNAFANHFDAFKHGYTMTGQYFANCFRYFGVPFAYVVLNSPMDGNLPKVSILNHTHTTVDLTTLANRSSVKAFQIRRFMGTVPIPDVPNDQSASRYEFETALFVEKPVQTATRQTRPMGLEEAEQTLALTKTEPPAKPDLSKLSAAQLFPMIMENGSTVQVTVSPDAMEQQMMPEAVELLPGQLFALNSTGFADSPRRARGHRAGAHFINLEHIIAGRDVRTTVMLRNIPNKMTQRQVLHILKTFFKAHFDFFYLRIDFRNGTNVGYGFVNLTSAEAVFRFVVKMRGYKWPNSDKIADVSYATMQGRETLIQKFRNSNVMQQQEHCRPMLFDRFGEEEPFPTPDNFMQLQRSIQNAHQEGLYAHT